MFKILWNNFSKNNAQKREALIALTAASFIWGASTPLLKWMLAVVPIFLLAYLRFFTAALLLLLFRPNLKIDKKDVPTVIFASLLGTTFHIPIFFWGLSYTSAINAGVLGAATPLLTLLLAAFYLKEKIKFTVFIGGVIGIAGLIIILLDGGSENGISQNIFGNFLLLSSTLSWIFYEMVSKKLFKKYNALTITFYTFLIGGVTFMPLALMDLTRMDSGFFLKKEFYIGIPITIIFTSTLAYYLWQWGISKLDVVRAGFFQYLNPVVSTIFSFFFLGEPITQSFIFGTVFIFTGLIIAEKKLHLPEIHLIHHVLRNKKNSH